MVWTILGINHHSDIWNFWNYPHFTLANLKIFKKALWQFIQNWPPKHMVTCTNYVFQQSRACKITKCFAHEVQSHSGLSGETKIRIFITWFFMIQLWKVNSNPVYYFEIVHQKKKKKCLLAFIYFLFHVLRLYKSLESGNGTKISDKKWRSVKPKYLENKKW